MIRAPDSRIIARRSLVSTDPHWRPMAGASMTIAQARQAYDAGIIEMATGRDGDDATLYAIPRRNLAFRPPWFSRRVAA